MLTFLYIILVITALVLAAVILIQDSKAGGLSGAFGGAGGGDALLGASGAKQISKFTAFLSVFFFILCVTVGVIHRNQLRSSRVAEDPPAVSQVEPGGTGNSVGLPPIGNGPNTGGAATDPPGGTDPEGKTGDGKPAPGSEDVEPGGGETPIPVGDSAPRQNEDR